MKKIITLLIMAAVAASCFIGCKDTSTSSGESNITGNGEKSSSVEESSSVEDESSLPPLAATHHTRKSV